MFENVAIFQRFNDLLLEMGHQASVDALLSLVTSSLSSFMDAALVRIWLVHPGDICHKCSVATSCEDKSQCLHLVASSGKSIVDGTVWNRTDGAFARLAMGMRKVGQIAASGQPLELAHVDPYEAWVANPEWIISERISSVGGHALIFRGQVLGVLVTFTRSPFDKDAFFLLRMVADHLAHSIVNARAFEKIDAFRQQLEMENKYLRAETRKNHPAFGMIGKTVQLRNIIQNIELVARTDANIFISGESGTGKELVATEIHRRSKRSRYPMIKVNCSAIPSELFSSEFFGHVKGAFTGAVKDRMGFFSAAHQGTLFLDEVTEIPLAQQSILLRVLQDGDYHRVGDDKIHQVNVRIISATNENPIAAVTSGRFRSDLFYRLHVFPIVVPPLRERKEDIILLAERFLQSFSNRMGKQGLKLSPEDAELLTEFAWPGNVRQLQNVIEYGVITTPPGNSYVRIPESIHELGVLEPRESTGRNGCTLSDSEMRCFEKENLMRALERCNFKVYGSGGAAELLGARPTTVIARMKKFGINKPLSHR